MHYNETLARRLVAEVDNASAGRPVRWVTLQQIARLLKVHRSTAAAAVRVAVDGGWLIAEGCAFRPPIETPATVGGSERGTLAAIAAELEARGVRTPAGRST